MKLTETQKQNVINYLINQGLEYKEFIDEMYDHFIDSIEAKMDAGISFVDPLEATANEFKNEIYQRFPFGLFPIKGLRALERRFYKSKEREMTVTIKSNLKSSVFSVSSILILCYVGLVGYLFQDFSIPTRYIMFVALFSTTILIVVARKTIGNNADKIGGFSWLMASKKERVRSIFTDLVVNSVRAKWMSWIVTSWLIVNFANRFDKIPDNIYIYFTLFLTAIALFTQVETIKMIPRIKMSIED